MSTLYQLEAQVSLKVMFLIVYPYVLHIAFHLSRLAMKQLGYPTEP
jgi:hypothetical protein